MLSSTAKYKVLSTKYKEGCLDGGPFLYMQPVFVEQILNAGAYNLFLHQTQAMRYLLLLISLMPFSIQAQIGPGQMHCGYDFTSYVVLDVHEAGKTERIKNLRITIVDSLDRELININNLYSWTNGNKPLLFTSNYKIDDSGKRLEEGTAGQKERWFFPFAKDVYLLSVANTFPADKFRVKIEDTDGKENERKFKTVIIPLYNYNMYILCTNESREAGIKFGRKMNKPIDVVMEKE